ncbi:MAG TPA: PQQ-dependent sugar dehydrogenase [Roseiflexaceae bacterium]|nr:PQQ-dependent sugar dehydrogenase [Roseiflexaceae bacterium]
MRQPRRLAALLLAACLLAGCGAEEGRPQTGAPTVFSTSPRPQPTAAAPAATAEPNAAPAGQPTAQPAAGETPTIALSEIADGLDQPLHVTHAGDGSGRLFVVEKPGRIVVVRDGRAQEPAFLDITDRVGSESSEQGLLSVAFHPRYAENGRLFVNYTDREGDTVIARFQAQGDAADPQSEAVLLTIDQPYPNHNGGLVKFGPDGFLYIGMGDGGSGGDPQGNGQKMTTLLGKMLRIDVDSEPYAVPPDNPWAGQSDARGEIWSYGLRNPWRFSFDRATGALFIADVGQNAYEEINLQQRAEGGDNYGWNVTEGLHCFRNDSCADSDLVAPVAEYDHENGNGCSITGGYVYRGSAAPSLQGFYFFGDYCSGRMWTLREVTPGAWQQTPVLDSRLNISSFGEDEAGELYLTDIRGGTLYQIQAAR